MNYKTIILELILQRPALQRQLKQNRTILQAVNHYANQLKASHEDWKKMLSQTRPGSALTQISGEAMELAIQELELALPFASDQQDDDLLSLDTAMDFLRRATPNA
jgi:hypothetical protein